MEWISHSYWQLNSSPFWENHPAALSLLETRSTGHCSGVSLPWTPSAGHHPFFYLFWASDFLFSLLLNKFPLLLLFWLFPLLSWAGDDVESLSWPVPCRSGAVRGLLPIWALAGGGLCSPQITWREQLCWKSRLGLRIKGNLCSQM